MASGASSHSSLAGGSNGGRENSTPRSAPGLVLGMGESISLRDWQSTRVGTNLWPGKCKAGKEVEE